MNAVPCPSCGSAVEQTGTGRPKVYCSVRCRRAAEMRVRRQRTELNTTWWADLEAGRIDMPDELTVEHLSAQLAAESASPPGYAGWTYGGDGTV